jgi:hypothetical protein
MPQPPQVEASARSLIERFKVAQGDIQAQLEALARQPDNRVARRRARLRELAQSVDGLLADLEADASTWLTDTLPETYQLGARTAAGELGQAFQWSQPHLAAVQQLANETFDQVLSATGYVRETTKQWVRDQARRQTTLSLLEGRTAQQAARALVSAAGDVVDALGGPVGMVRYADGSYRRLADYADTLLRTATARCYNAGSLNQFTHMGVGFVEVIDGADCGWATHNDGDKANGTVRRTKDAFEHSLSHPRCRRSFSARPDVKDIGEAATAVPTTTAAQRADQAQAERDRADAFRRRRVGRQQRGRSATTRPTRAPRTPRTRAPAAARVRGPLGPKVSDSLDTSAVPAAMRSSVERALAAIDRLHGLGGRTLDTIPLTANKSRTYGGMFRSIKDGRAVDIRISRLADTPDFTLAHEVGHWLDHSALGSRSGRFASLSGSSPRPDVPEIAEWYDAIHNTRAYRELHKMPAAYSRTRTYMLKTEELWARSYSQWVAVRSGDDVLLAQLASHRVRPASGHYIAQQWDDDDFEPLLGIFDRLFATAGFRAP